MQRELNPDLFGEKRLGPETAAAPAFVADNPLEPSFLDIDRQILDIKNHLQKLDENDRRQQGQVSDFVKSTNIKIERLHQLISRLETSHNGLAQEIAQRLTNMQQRIVERASYDEKTQEMIDRHNQIIKSFEVRMNQMQKILQEKENILTAAMVALNDAKAEIARLKRL